MTREQLNQEWIDAKQQLPEKDGDYLVVYFPFSSQEKSDSLGLGLKMRQEIFICYFARGSFRSPIALKRPELRNIPLNNIQYWTPLPTPPKQGS